MPQKPLAPDTDVSQTLENEIDKLVYELYNLMEDEIHDCGGERLKTIGLETTDSSRISSRDFRAAIDRRRL